jgi:hypothetical protein
MAVMFQVEVFCVMMVCSVVVGYQNSRGPSCLHLQGEKAGKGENVDIGTKLERSNRCH